MLTSGHIDLSYDVERELLRYASELGLERMRIDNKIRAIHTVVSDVREGRIAQRRVALVKVNISG